MKTNKRISILLLVVIIGVNITLTNKTKQSEIDLDQLSNVAVASGEEDPNEEEPIYEPTGIGIVDWFAELIGF